MSELKNNPLSDELKPTAVRLGLGLNVTYQQVSDWLFRTHSLFINIEDKRKMNPISDTLQENSGFIVYITNKNGIVVYGTGGHYYDDPDKALQVGVRNALIMLIQEKLNPKK